MHRRFMLWFVALLVAAAVVIVGRGLLAPVPLDGHDAAFRLPFLLAIAGLFGIAVDAILQVRAGARAARSLLPFIALVLAFGVAFPRDIAATARFLANPQSSQRQSDGIICAPGKDGRYRPRLVISGQPVDFVLDTSVEDIVLQADDAGRIGIDVASLVFDDEVRIGSVRSAAATVELDDVTFAGLTIDDLPVKVSANTLGGNVLGTDFLDRFSRWRIEDGVLILEP